MSANVIFFGPGKLLRRAIEADRISSIILYGPPGVGKTSLAHVIAASTQSRFERLSGVEGSVADIRRVVAQAANRLQNTGQKTILFIDEIHRFNKAQQDVLLPDVESGLLRLIGATTHNPFFYVNSPLVSRSQIFQLEPLSTEDLLTLIRQAWTDKERGLGELRLRIDDDAAAHLAKVSDGDARKCLNALEIAARTTPPDRSGLVHITLSAAEESIQRKAVVYDADGDAHYDTISAFIKSLRGSDPDAAIYWLAKMLYAGEDIRFIARRLIICASEDVGMADSNALVIATSAQQAVEFVGLPEAQLILAHVTVYVATAPKSNRCTVAIGKASAEVREGRTLAIPSISAMRTTKRRRNSGTERVTSIVTTMKAPTFLKLTFLKGASTMSRAKTAWKSASKNASTTGESSSMRIRREPPRRARAKSELCSDRVSPHRARLG